MGNGEHDTVHCPAAVQFYTAAKEVEALEFLAVVQVAPHHTLDGDTRQPREKLNSEKYVYNIILSIAKAL